MVIKPIEAGEFEAYPDAMRFVLTVKASGIPIAAAPMATDADS
jgi:adenine/guanine phosphoribosyltransferase-like PRPP-binding protein